jgi:hypothetical protein
MRDGVKVLFGWSKCFGLTTVVAKRTQKRQMASTNMDEVVAMVCSKSRSSV